MKEIVLNGLDQSVFYDEINGLKVILIPFENRRDYYVNYTAKYGSINLDFIPKGESKYYNSPKGIAHFLEHKMFEQEDGIDPFVFYSKSGTECNAGTSYTKTSYYIYGLNNINENLNYLINCINSPYFTDENVEKEKGIIIQEIKMYDDNPDWILEETTQKAIFNNHPIKYDIAGYPETVSMITKEDLYKCYNTFYVPNNMYLVVSGKFNKDEIIDIIKNNEKLKNSLPSKEMKNKKIDEKKSVVKENEELYLDNVAVNKSTISFKISLRDIKDKYEFHMYLSAIISILFGAGSSFKEEMFKKGYASYIDCDKMLIDDFYIIEFYAELMSNDVKKIKEEIVDRLKNIEVKEEELKRYIKVLISSSVIGSDNPRVLADGIISDLINFNTIINDKIDLIRNMNFERFREIRKSIDLSNSSIVVLKAKNKK
ncbi:MAG: pitrilysin family protein [bacterium]|nr:pitrilysin family protein [bacterium]